MRRTTMAKTDETRDEDEDDDVERGRDYKEVSPVTRVNS